MWWPWGIVLIFSLRSLVNGVRWRPPVATCRTCPLSYQCVCVWVSVCEKFPCTHTLERTPATANCLFWFESVTDFSSSFINSAFQSLGQTSGGGGAAVVVVVRSAAGINIILYIHFSWHIPIFQNRGCWVCGVEELPPLTDWTEVSPVIWWGREETVSLWNEKWRIYYLRRLLSWK